MCLTIINLTNQLTCEDPPVVWNAGVALDSNDVGLADAHSAVVARQLYGTIRVTVACWEN